MFIAHQMRFLCCFSLPLKACNTLEKTNPHNMVLCSSAFAEMGKAMDIIKITLPVKYKIIVKPWKFRKSIAV